VCLCAGGLLANGAACLCNEECSGGTCYQGACCGTAGGKGGGLPLGGAIAWLLVRRRRRSPLRAP
jgi:uncharacterized protein (TIGR03382 family)